MIYQDIPSQTTTKISCINVSAEKKIPFLPPLSYSCPILFPLSWWDSLPPLFLAKRFYLITDCLSRYKISLLFTSTGFSNINLKLIILKKFRVSSLKALNLAYLITLTPYTKEGTKLPDRFFHILRHCALKLFKGG